LTFQRVIFLILLLFWAIVERKIVGAEKVQNLLRRHLKEADLDGVFVFFPPLWVGF